MKTPALKVIKNASGQLSLQTGTGESFDMSKHIGDAFFTKDQLEAERINGIKECIALLKKHEPMEYGRQQQKDRLLELLK
jgi:hypothetical protein